MTNNCLGLGPASLESPSEWPIMAKRILLGLMFVSMLAFLGYNFGEVVMADPVIQVIFSIVAVGIGFAAWYRGKNIPQSVFVQCALCGEWVDINICRTIPNISGSTCGQCSEYL